MSIINEISNLVTAIVEVQEILDHLRYDEFAHVHKYVEDTLHINKLHLAELNLQLEKTTFIKNMSKTAEGFGYEPVIEEEYLGDPPEQHLNYTRHFTHE